MAITAKAGWMIDPNNPNGVVQIPGYIGQEPGTNTPPTPQTPTQTPTQTGTSITPPPPGGATPPPPGGGGYDPTYASYGITPEIWKALGTADLTDPKSTALFSSVMNSINGGIQSKNTLIDQKNAVVQAMLGGTVPPDRLAKLPPDIQSMIASGNRDALMLQASDLNSQIQGFNNSVASSLNFYTTGYNNAVTQAQTQKQAAIDTLMKTASTFVDPKTGQIDLSRFKAAAQSMFPGTDVSGLVSELQGLMPVTEFNKQLQYPTYAGDTSGGTSDVTSLMQSIANEEGNGSYDQKGVVTASGDRAYGKYQIMGNNIPTWTQQALGKSMTPQEFLADPNAQDQTAQYMLGQYLSTYGNAADAASMWFTGLPADKSKGLVDANGTKSEDYVNNVVKGLSTTSGSSTLPPLSTVASQVGGNANDPAFSAAYSLVAGDAAPSQIPKRSTGSQSWLDILKYANKISQKLFKTNFNAEQADASFAYLKSPKTQATLASLNYTVKTLNDLKTLSAKVDRGSVTFGNKAGMWLQYNGSDQNTVNFITKVNGAIDDLGAALGGGISTDKKLDIAKSIIDPTLSNNTFDSQMNVDLGTIYSRIDAINTQAGQPTDLSNTQDTSGGGGTDYTSALDALMK